jgi:hypothetical protein
MQVSGSHSETSELVSTALRDLDEEHCQNIGDSCLTFTTSPYRASPVQNTILHVVFTNELHCKSAKAFNWVVVPVGPLMT